MRLDASDGRLWSYMNWIQPFPFSSYLCSPFMEEASKKGIHVFDYLFYVDLEASMAEPRAQNALRHLQVSERGREDVWGRC